MFINIPDKLACVLIATLKMEALGFFEMLVTVYQLTYNIPKEPTQIK
jgi:hypothetical protein